MLALRLAGIAIAIWHYRRARRTGRILSHGNSITGYHVAERGKEPDDFVMGLLGPFYTGLFGLGMAVWGMVLIIRAAVR